MQTTTMQTTTPPLYPYHTAPVGILFRQAKSPARMPKMPGHTSDEINDLKVLVRWAGMRPLRHNRRHQYRQLGLFGVI